jgi:pantoate ligase/cytidylate kinase
VAAQSAVRQFLVQQQQNYGSRGGLVAEGRDIGTHVFPHAELKIFLTASVRERARRRRQDLERQGQNVMSLDRLEQAIAERDRKDSTRVLAPLCKAPEAIEIQTDGLSISDVIGKIVDCYHEKMAEVPTLSRS